MKEGFLIVLCGLPGTGKTTVAQKLFKGSMNYFMIGQNEVRRRHGIKKMPKTQDAILREIDRNAAYWLRLGYGVIVDSVNRYLFRRHQLYGVASCCGRRVLVIETVCSEETAKKRMRERAGGDGLISDPNQTEVYDRLKALWEDVQTDFKYPGEDHVSWVKFDSEQNTLQSMIVRKGAKKLVASVKKILVV